MRWLPLIASLLIAAPAAAQPSASALDAGVRQILARTHAHGLAIAVIENGRVVSTAAHGIRNARGELLTTDTVMYGASLTKAVFAYGVMKLVDEGRLDLDKPIAAILP